MPATNTLPGARTAPAFATVFPNHTPRTPSTPIDMNEILKNKYRNPSMRLQTWDYRRAAAYLITICTLNRLHYFGYIQNGDMIHSEIGIAADTLWMDLPNRVEGITLGAFVVMPNHIHGILHLTGLHDHPQKDTPNTTSSAVASNHMSRISPKSGSVSTIIRAYKGAVTREANRMGLEFGWQTRFHDHIIRDVDAYNRITQYITDNPSNWDKDKFRPNPT
jgi:putative transposase